MSNITYNGRTPIIALDYKERSQAVNGELLVDYDHGCNVYIVDKNDRHVIYDLTDSVIQILSQDFPGRAVEVEVTGFGVINLEDYLNQLEGRMLQPSNAGIVRNDSSTANFIPDFFLDQNSISLDTEGVVSVHGFKDANHHQVPTMENGVIAWRPYTDLKVLKQVGSDINIEDGILTLEGNTYYLYEDAKQDFNIQLNSPAYDIFVNKIELCMSVGSVIPKIKYDDRIRWEWDDYFKIYPNTYTIYKFMTYNNGSTWFGKVSRFTKDGAPIHAINADYMKDYYTKEEVQQLLLWHGNGPQPNISPIPKPDPDNYKNHIFNHRTDSSIPDDINY